MKIQKTGIYGRTFYCLHMVTKHKSTGFSPFQLQYGGPLSMVKNNWINEPGKYVELFSEYVEELRKKLLNFGKKAEKYRRVPNQPRKIL